MKPTQQEAAEAAAIVRKYMNGEKVCKHYIGPEADELFHCSYILQEWTHDGKFTMEHINKEYEEEYAWAHSISTYNYHMEEGSVGLL